MKKLIIAILGLSLFCFSANAFERKIGFSASMAMLDTTVTDDIDSNGSIDTSKDISNDVIIPSLFLEFATDLPNGAKASFGIDYIPMSAELESRSTTQSSNGTSGTNSGTLDASNHITAYATLGGDVAGNHVFALAGMMYAEGEYDLKSVSSTNSRFSPRDFEIQKQILYSLNFDVITGRSERVKIKLPIGSVLLILSKERVSGELSSGKNIKGFDGHGRGGYIQPYYPKPEEGNSSESFEFYVTSSDEWYAVIVPQESSVMTIKPFATYLNVNGEFVTRSSS